MTTSTSQAQAADNKPIPTSEALQQEAQAQGDNFYPPSISEVFENAKNNGITTDWKNQVQIPTSQDYLAMPLPKRAFEVGKGLADIAFLILDNEESPPIHLVQYADSAIMSLNPPENIQNEVQKLKQATQMGELKGKELRNKISELLNEQVPLIEDTEDPQVRDSGVIMALSGYLRGLYLGAQALANMAAPTKNQLEMIKGMRDTINHYSDYLKNKINSTFKKSTEVRNLMVALTRILPILEKDNVTKDDAKAVTQTLSLLF
jgi:hypothetical protein